MQSGRWQRTEIGYCSNVHAGADASAVCANIQGPIREVREHRRLDRMATGLWLSAAAARSFAADIGQLRELLQKSHLNLQTLNGFPYGDFHQSRVKEAVYAPAWDHPARLAYTLDLARILDHCLPDDSDFGTISSLPLGFASGWSAEREKIALENLCRLAEGLARQADRSGRHLRVCIEPEPDCAIETTNQVLRLFLDALPATARRIGVAADSVTKHLGICLDVCHLAVQFEDPAAALVQFVEAGVSIGKLQVSSALLIEQPDRPDLAALLVPFAEPRYLHQVRCRRPNGTIAGCIDLPAALSDCAFPRDGPWRVHFHMPLQWAGAGGLSTCAGAIGDVLDAMLHWPRPLPHLEVETYTWQILPPDRRPHDEAALTTCLATELYWLEQSLSVRGLLAISR